MAKIYDAIEIALTMRELKQALSAWMQCKASVHDFRVTEVSLSPRGEYVVRFRVEPPLTKEAKEKIVAAGEEAKEC